MKNIQVIDGAVNSTFEIYSVPESVFKALFPGGADVAFAVDFSADDSRFHNLYAHRVEKRNVSGIHGTLHLELSPVIPSSSPTGAKQIAFVLARSK